MNFDLNLRAGEHYTVGEAASQEKWAEVVE